MYKHACTVYQILFDYIYDIYAIQWIDLLSFHQLECTKMFKFHWFYIVP